MEKILGDILQELKSLKQGQEKIKETLSKMDKRQEGIFEQTAGLSEFRTKLTQIELTQEAISETLGRHEVQKVQIKTINKKML